VVNFKLDPKMAWKTELSSMGGGAGTPDHALTHQRSPQDGGYFTPVSYALTKAREPETK